MEKRTWNENYELAKKELENKRTISNFTNKKVESWLRFQVCAIRNGIKDKDGNYRYNEHILDKEKVRKIEILNLNLKYTWDDNFILYANAKDKTTLNRNVKRWADKNRSIYSKGSKLEDGSYVYICKGYKYYLTKEQISKLNSINFNWKIKSDFNRNVKLYKEFYDKYYRLPKNNEIFEGVELEKWAKYFRMIKSKGKLMDDGSYRYQSHILTKEQFYELNKINFTWNKREYEFVTNYFDMNYKKKVKKLVNRLEILLSEKEEINFNNKNDIITINEEFYDSLGIGTPFETNITKKLKK